MTFIAIPFMIADSDDAHDAIGRLQARPQRSGLVCEWRIDDLCADIEIDQELVSSVVRELVDQAPGASIITARSAAEGGAAVSAEAAALALFRMDGLEARYIDVEYQAVETSATLRAACRGFDARGETDLIFSTHDFQQRPPDLLKRVAGMAAEPSCSIIKVAWMARSLRDNLEAFDLLRERHRPTIALCMGPFGLMSRVLAPKFGGFLTFAAEHAGVESAPGQPSCDDLIDLYRFDSIDASTRVYGVIGWPVEHSKSPALHNAAFGATGTNAVYLPLPIPKEYEHFKATVGAMIDHAGLDFSGASITLPHKENLVRFVRERGGVIGPIAERCGAANTLIIHEDHSIECINTDAMAAVDEICAALELDREQLRARRVAMLGAGGVARGIVAALLQCGAHVTVFNRTERRAVELCESMDAPADRLSVGNDDGAQDFEIIVNATSVGMSGGPDPDGSPLARFPSIQIGPGVLVFDTIYTPEDTPLLVDAASRGALTRHGGGMFRRQAALQFERWTGIAMPNVSAG